ncbi:EST gb/AA605362 comes from this gene, partial [Arabidopsis thaliana]
GDAYVSGHGSCIFPGSKKVGNRTQTVVNSTEVAAGEATSRSLSRGFCVTIMILVTFSIL